MLDGIYTWIRSLAGYFLFITVLEQLLPGKNYAKYMRLFAGMVLILLVIRPLADVGRLEERITQDYETLLFQYDTGDLKEEILGMEQERLSQIVSQYEEAVAGDVRLMAEDAGLAVQSCQVRICAEQGAEAFGAVTEIRMRVYEGGENEKTEEIPAIEPVRPVEPVEINRETAREETDRVKASDGRPAAAAGTAENAKITKLRRRISDYYKLEASYVEIQMVEGKR